MFNYINLNFFLIYSLDLLKLIIRKNKEKHIIGLLDSSSIFLHKKKRFRPGGLFCEEIFGYLYICLKHKCKPLKFNKNLILNIICSKCKTKMKYNSYRKYRFGAIFFNFPIFNFLYFDIFSNNLILFDLISPFKSYNLYSIKYVTYYDKFYIPRVLFSYDSLIISVFLNFINLFYKFFSTLEIFKYKLNLIKLYNKTLFKQLLSTHTNINHIYLFKNIFLLLFPILPIGLRKYNRISNSLILNSKFNILYKFIIDVNNKILNEDYYFQYNIKYIFMLFTLIKILLTYTNLQSIFNYNITIYSKLQGKYGIFRQNLLGFRVDYSGRAVIISSPDLYLDSIGLPITMLKYSLNNIIFKDSNKISEEEIKIYYNSDLLNLNLFNNLNKFSFIVNRAPTLHKMNTQSFYPMFTEGRAIKFMPILCVGYNADFDGDQMGVFSILFNSSLLESLNTLRPIVNLLSSTNKKNILNLTQGALLGLNILSIYNYFNFIKYYIINNYTTLIELNTNNILINTPLLLRYNYYFYLTTIGRSLLNIKLIK